MGIVLVACVGDDPVGSTPAPDASASSSSGGNDGSSGASSGTPANDACANTCAGQCVDFQTDPANCGSCGKSCTTTAGKSFACVAGECGNKAVKVSMGTYAACLAVRDGSVWCWGYRETGILGAAALGGSPIPTKVNGLTKIVDVGVGHEHACALDSDGDVWCWGYNNMMQTGVASNATDCTSYDGSEVNRCHVPRKVPLPAKAAQLTVGTSTSCARTVGATGGDVYCWGRNTTRVISASAASGGGVAPTKIAVFAGDAGQVSISGDDNGTRVHACAVKTNGEVWCWGANQKGQLGRSGGDIACNYCDATPKPALVNGSGTTAFGDVKSVHAMVDATCALRNDKSVWCWGSRIAGQTAQATDDLEHPDPTLVPGLEPAAHFAAAGYNAFIADAAGNVKGWGIADYHTDAVGAGYETCSAALLCFDAPVNVPALSGVTQLAPGLHSAAAMRGGLVIAWGRNNYGQCGHAPGVSDDVKCPVSDDKCNSVPKTVGDLP